MFIAFSALLASNSFLTESMMFRGCVYCACWCNAFRSFSASVNGKVSSFSFCVGTRGASVAYGRLASMTGDVL